MQFCWSAPVSLGKLFLGLSLSINSATAICKSLVLLPPPFPHVVPLVPIKDRELGERKEEAWQGNLQLPPNAHTGQGKSWRVGQALSSGVDPEGIIPTCSQKGSVILKLPGFLLGRMDKDSTDSSFYIKLLNTMQMAWEQFQCELFDVSRISEWYNSSLLM